MKKTIFIVLITANALFVFSQNLVKKQTLIPLDNLNGVPFYKDQSVNDLVIDGFEVDQKNNFYFLGGEKTTCLAVFSNNKPIYRKAFSKLSVSQLYFYKNNLYTFNQNNNDLVVLNPTNGLLIKRYNHIINKNVNSFAFVDSSLIVEVLGEPNSTYEQYSLNGKYIRKVYSIYNIAPSMIPQKNKDVNTVFIGKWNDNYVFWEITGDNLDTQTFWLVNKQGEILKTKILPNDTTIFGREYYESFPTEHRKVRNGNLYVLGRKGNYALITEVPLKSFFGQ